MPETLREDADIIVFKKEQGEDTEILASSSGFFPVHRLDRETGGLLVMAKNQKAASRLSEEVRDGNFHKEYYAVLEGVIENKEGRYEDFLFRDKTKNKTYVVKSQRAGVRKAVLDYNIVAESGGLSLAKIKLVTGRTHQIRAQFASRGTPVYGDGRYGGKGKGKMALWSHIIIFTHPATGEKLSFISRPPEEDGWKDFIQVI